MALFIFRPKILVSFFHKIRSLPPMSIGLLFSGQGSQTVGMGLDFFQETDEMRECFEIANRELGYRLDELCFSGPLEKLTQTSVCQVALFVVGYGIFQALKSRGKLKNLAVCCGLSLGEWTALAATEAVDFREGIHLVARRGLLMQRACETVDGAMVSVGSGDRRRILELCRATDVDPSNFNSPDQVVVSGERKKIENFLVKAKEAGLRRIIPLNVAGAYHSRLMRSAQEEFERDLRSATFHLPSIPVISNVTGRKIKDSGEIRHLLAQQITSPVLWDIAMQEAAQIGADTFLECGPGKVLCGLGRKNLPSASFFGCGTIEQLNSLPENL